MSDSDSDNESELTLLKESEKEDEQEDEGEELKKCNICLKLKNSLKCNECSFYSCLECIGEWIMSCNNHNCPYCKEIQSFPIKYSEHKLTKSSNDILVEQLTESINNVSISSVISTPVMNSITKLSNINPFRENQIFSPEGFIDLYNNCSEEIKNKWSYQPIKMEIDNNYEIVGYTIIKIIKTRLF